MNLYQSKRIIYKFDKLINLGLKIINADYNFFLLKIKKKIMIMMILFIYSIHDI
jgi:hypothetical protein